MHTEISSLLKSIMIDGRPFKKVKDHKPQKAHLQPLRDVCVQYERNPPMGFGDLLRKENAERGDSVDVVRTSTDYISTYANNFRARKKVLSSFI